MASVSLFCRAEMETLQQQQQRQQQQQAEDRTAGDVGLPSYSTAVENSGNNSERSEGCESEASPPPSYVAVLIRDLIANGTIGADNAASADNQRGEGASVGSSNAVYKRWPVHVLCKHCSRSVSTKVSSVVDYRRVFKFPFYRMAQVVDFTHFCPNCQQKLGSFQSVLDFRPGA